MNMFLGIIAIVVCVIISIALSQKYTIRRKFFEDFYNFNYRLKTEVAFSQKTILALIDELYDSKSLFFVNLRAKFRESEGQLEIRDLKKNEIDYFDVYLKTIGTSDKTTQLKFLETVDVDVGKVLKNTKEEEIKYKSLYVKLGFLIGIAILIILL